MMIMFWRKRILILLAAIPLLIILILSYVFSKQDAGYLRAREEHPTRSDGSQLVYDLHLPTSDEFPADGPVLEAEQGFRPSDTIVLIGKSHRKEYDVVFEDDGDTGYF